MTRTEYTRRLIKLIDLAALEIAHDTTEFLDSEFPGEGSSERAASVAFGVIDSFDIDRRLKRLILKRLGVKP